MTLLTHEDIERGIDVRLKAMKRGDYELATNIKTTLAAHGISLTDSPSGTIWRYTKDSSPSALGRYRYTVYGSDTLPSPPTPTRCCIPYPIKL